MLSDIEDQNPADWYSDDDDAQKEDVWGSSNSKKGKGLTAKHKAIVQRQSAQR